MKCYGLLGYPLGHSFSKGYFADRLDYRNFEYPEVVDFIAEKPATLAGFNVTIPHKQAIIPFLDSASPEAQQIGAVNCVRIDSEGLMHGYNTDCMGFEASLLELIAENRPKALVLGYGGAARAVCYTLEKLGIEFKIVSRQSELNYQTLTPQIIDEHHLIINTTPLGMYPKIDTAPQIDYESLTKNHYLYDLVYNPAETLFLKKGRRQGAQVANGLQMLKVQADRAYQIWTEEN
ncbi:MAG: shikimate dehydrogenase [Rikenellaceae bacterium]